MRRLSKAFTLVELLVVISIIALLVAILMPALGKVRTQAKVAGLKATFHSMTMGLELFVEDNGSYPSSRAVPALDMTFGPPGIAIDNGAHLLVEALAGIDLLGNAQNEYYDFEPDTGQPLGSDMLPTERKGPYVPVENIEVYNFRQIDDDPSQDVGEAFAKVNFQAPALTSNMNPVFVDNFKPQRPRPILYYKANKRNTTMRNTNTNADGRYEFNIFDYSDNSDITNDYGMDVYSSTITGNNATDYKFFSYFSWDTKTGNGATPFDSGTARPYNRDSFILWSAGPDGEYGTEDDVTNFERK